jgi:DNA-binding NtrC family response regulator
LFLRAKLSGFGQLLYDFGQFRDHAMTDSAKILVVDDDDDILTAARLLLRRRFGEIVTCRRPEQIPDLLAEHDFDAVLLDMNFGPGESSGMQGLEWLGRILQIDPQMVVVMITAHGNIETAVDAMKHGATDFVAKPWQNEKVVATLSAAVELHRSRVESESLRDANRVLVEAAAPSDRAIIYESAAMRAVLSLVERAAPTDANVLILGENGTGKELIARELHRQSARAGNVFLAIDMGSITESLFESELFGHRKGAFTGATDNRPGRFQAANGGTLFLDEIGNLPLNQQAKLLSALEQRKVMPVGADKTQDVDVRIIAATNVPAEQLRDDARFRQDLLFRLNTVEITVPPLRERRDEGADRLRLAGQCARPASRHRASHDPDIGPRHRTGRPAADRDRDRAGRRTNAHPYGHEPRPDGEGHDPPCAYQTRLQHLACCQGSRADARVALSAHGKTWSIDASRYCSQRA